ncbi:MAG: sulfotransferase family 2 domain-containing protein [Saprospiraceae bacterium]|nr:sulfotransferase family 2 domain-containing protein [Saprospiraceae bacterium]
MIISLHTPKAGGSSFKVLLQNHFGKSLLSDYADIPINKSFKERTKDVLKFNDNFNLLKRLEYKARRIKCIHGHFLPYKYQKLLNNKNIFFITWLREPSERLISHYYYWQRAYNENSAPLHKKVVEESWSLEKFCLSEEMENFYGKFLWKFPIEKFDFIGITEHFEDDVSFFTKNYLKGYKINNVPKKNTNPNNSGFYSDKISSELLSNIKSFHSKDYEMYEYAVEKRKDRIKSMSNILYR